MFANHQSETQQKKEEFEKNLEAATQDAEKMIGATAEAAEMESEGNHERTAMEVAVLQKECDDLVVTVETCDTK